MMAPFRDNDRLTRAIEEILDRLASPRSSSARRIELLAQLEHRFGLAVLDESGGETSSRQAKESEWWNAQMRPRSCVALALVSLVHRLHLTAILSAPTPSDPSEEMTACFTMLQGLCLKDAESGKICADRSTLELMLAIVDAPYWSSTQPDNQALAHAIDLLICVTMASRNASALFDLLKGEDVVRSLMERHVPASAGTLADGRRTITLDAVKGSPIAIKCAEFLLLFASERNESGNKTMDILADQTSLFGDASVLLFSRPSKPRDARLTGPPPASDNVSEEMTESALQRSRRARSSSPIKTHGKRHRTVEAAPPCDDKGTVEQLPRVRRSVPTAGIVSELNAARSRALASNSRPLSPVKSYPPPNLASPTKPSTSIPSTPFERSSRAPKAERDVPTSSDAVMPSPRRGRSLERNPLMQVHANSAHQTASCNDSTPLLPSSPLKSLIGPSPAVRRAHARSVSPQKKTPLL